MLSVCAMRRGACIRSSIISVCIVGLVLLISLLRASLPRYDGACVRSTEANKTVLNQLIVQALAEGVPAASLRTIALQEAPICRINLPLLLLSQYAASSFYREQANQYAILIAQVQRSITITNTRQQARITLLHREAFALIAQLQRKAAAWARTHPYHDSYDGHSYALDAGYMQQGIGGVLTGEMANARTPADFAAIIAEAQNATFNFSLFTAAYQNRTPYDRAHASDIQLLHHYQLTKQQVILVSLAQQAMRIYQNGRLLAAYNVTTGRQELPSLPGVWRVLDRKSPMIFVSNEPRGTPFWFPNTPISYAILYHEGGYFIHDALWRANFGPGTQFPHQDARGTTPYNFTGSHGCINITENAAAWVYSHTDWHTSIIIY